MPLRRIKPVETFEHAVHVESHRRVIGETDFSQKSFADKLGFMAIIECVELPVTAREIRAELTLFQTELDMHGLAES